eukprot:366009-Chlamydomonas_euryale.AAC.20
MADNAWLSCYGAAHTAPWACGSGTRRVSLKSFFAGLVPRPGCRAVNTATLAGAEHTSNIDIDIVCNLKAIAPGDTSPRHLRRTATTVDTMAAANIVRGTPYPPTNEEAVAERSRRRSRLGDAKATNALSKLNRGAFYADKLPTSAMTKGDGTKGSVHAKREALPNAALVGEPPGGRWQRRRRACGTTHPWKGMKQAGSRKMRPVSAKRAGGTDEAASVCRGRSRRNLISLFATRLVFHAELPRTRR